MLYNPGLKIKSQAGFESFKGLQRVTKLGQIQIQLYSGRSLSCALTHNILCSTGWKTAESIVSGDVIKTSTGESKVFHVEYVQGEFTYYDIIETESHTYLTNGIVSHNCHFLGSSNTLISAKKLQQLAWKEPLEQHDNLSIYELAKDNHQYVITVDVSRGSNIDHSAFVVFDVTSIPYKVVAKYYDNEISPLLYPNVIFRVASHYNEALVLVEVNDAGQQVADILYHDLEYDGVLLTQTKGRSGVAVGGSYKVKPTRGIKTTKQVKRIGCANLKTLIENDKLLFNDYHIIYELFRFIENKASYEAEQGEHDDLVMCMVLFAWMANQQYFKGKSETDVRSDLWQDNKALIEETISPMPLYKGDEEPPKVPSINAFYNMDFHPDHWDAHRFGDDPEGLIL